MKIARTRTTAYAVRRWIPAFDPTVPLWWDGHDWETSIDRARVYTTRAVAQAVGEALNTRYVVTRCRVQAGTPIHDGD